jgi:hypothetical protein
MRTPQYLQLNKGGVSARMAILREMSARSIKDGLPPSLQEKTWREARKYGFGNWRAAYADFGQGLNNGEPVWYSHTGEKFRDEQYADEVTSHLRHTGWFTDVDSSETARGIVGRLSHNRFIAGYEWSSNGERVYFGRVFADRGEACTYADHYAQVFAEEEVEHDRKCREARDIEDELECAVVRLKECIVLRHQKCMGYIREEIAELVETIRDKRETLKTEYANVL